MELKEMKTQKLEYTPDTEFHPYDMVRRNDILKQGTYLMLLDLSFLDTLIH